MTARADLAPPDGLNRPWFLRGVENQAHVIGALILRELHTRFGRDNIGYLWIIAEPMLLATAVASVHTGTKNHFGSDMRTVPFTLLGYCIFMLFRSIFTRAETTLQSNQPLLYHRMVTIFDMLLARAVLEYIATMAAFMILLCGAVALGLADLPARPMELLAATLLMLWLAFALSMIVCAVGEFSHFISRLIHPLTYLLMPISGCFFALRWIPNPYREWLAWFPMTQIFEMAREGQFRAFQSEYIVVPYILVVNLVLTWLGLMAIKFARRAVHLR